MREYSAKIESGFKQVEYACCSVRGSYDGNYHILFVSVCVVPSQQKKIIYSSRWPAAE